MGIGACIIVDNKPIFECSLFEERSLYSSNNTAEYKALKEVLLFIVEKKLQNQKTVIYGNSKLVINQMNLKWKAGSGLYSIQAAECGKLRSLLTDVRFIWIPYHENKMAATLSKSALIIINPV